MAVEGGGGDGYMPVEHGREPYEQQMRKSSEQGHGNDDPRFEHGFLEGFSRARQIFWRDCQRRAKEAESMAAHIRSMKNGDQSLAATFDTVAATYINACDLISKGHSLYPGADASHTGTSDTDKTNQTLYYY